jgi:hypothetical protein
MRWVEHVARKKFMINAYKVMVLKPEGKRPLGKSRHRCEDTY